MLTSNLLSILAITVPVAVAILGEVPYGFDISLDKKGKITGDPVFLKKK